MVLGYRGVWYSEVGRLWLSWGKLSLAGLCKVEGLGALQLRFGI